MMNIKTMWRETNLYIVLMIASLIFGGCYQEEEGFTPPIPEEKLVKVLGDIHIAESMLTEILDREGKDSLAREYYGIIFTMYDVDAKVFDETMELYIQHPKAMHLLYEEVGVYLKDLEKQLPKVANKPKSNNNGDSTQRPKKTTPLNPLNAGVRPTIIENAKNAKQNQ